MASDSSSVFFSFPTRGITHFITDTQSSTERVEKKNKRTNTDLGQLQAQERGVCITFLCSFPCICRLSRACILHETSTKLRGMLTHLCLSSLTASSYRPSFPELLPQADCPPLPTVVNSLSLSSLGPSFPPPLLVSREISPSVLCVGFASKQTKRSSEWR